MAMADSSLLEEFTSHSYTDYLQQIKNTKYAANGHDERSSPSKPDPSTKQGEPTRESVAESAEAMRDKSKEALPKRPKPKRAVQPTPISPVVVAFSPVAVLRCLPGPVRQGPELTTADDFAVRGGDDLDTFFSDESGDEEPPARSVSGPHLAFDRPHGCVCHTRRDSRKPRQCSKWRRRRSTHKSRPL
jgi:hypothetical protein